MNAENGKARHTGARTGLFVWACVHAKQERENYVLLCHSYSTNEKTMYYIHINMCAYIIHTCV